MAASVGTACVTSRVFFVSLLLRGRIFAASLIEEKKKIAWESRESEGEKEKSFEIWFDESPLMAFRP